MVVGRNDDAIAEELSRLADVIRQPPHVNAGGHELDKAQAWLKAIEKIFQVMNYTDAQKRFDEDGIEVSWDLFRDEFLDNYFPKDVRGKKEVEFLELKQGNETVAEFPIITRFTELVNKSRIYDEDSRESVARYKSLNDQKGKGHRASECICAKMKCFKSGKPGYTTNDCRVGSTVTFYNCDCAARLNLVLSDMHGSIVSFL
ncbi:uncharacterized protein LOC131629458 [Vicia villosa]|uniref:uncharacterized protein LOC131629458 n=1 Tax=Vicia villosa TaxID=3911 RepID=UPI00273C99A8|nr:uncharacterized protein LOC131629458 [Vicia villosa]